MKLILLVIGLISVLQFAGAVPRFSLENGASCNLCHTNPTGGGMRNDYGTTVFALDELPRVTSESLENLPWDGFINDYLKIGGEFRIQSLVHENTSGNFTVPIFPMQADLTAMITPAGNLSVYANMRLAGGVLNEFWALFSGFSHDGWIMIGRLLPDYGLKPDDHTAFIRGGNIRNYHGLSSGGLFFKTGTLPAGIAAGIKIANGLRLTGGVTNAFIRGGEPGYGFNESLSRKAYSVKLSWVKSYFEWVHTLGAVSVIRESDITSSGISGGISFNGLTWLYEFDRIINGVQDSTSSKALYQELSYTPRQGFTITGRYEFFDPDLQYATGSIQRVVAGVEIFPVYGLQYIIQARLTRTDNVPGSNPKPEFLFQLHYWF